MWSMRLLTIISWWFDFYISTTSCPSTFLNLFICIRLLSFCNLTTRARNRWLWMNLPWNWWNTWSWCWSSKSLWSNCFFYLFLRVAIFRIEFMSYIPRIHFENTLLIVYLKILLRNRMRILLLQCVWLWWFRSSLISLCCYLTLFC